MFLKLIRTSLTALFLLFIGNTEAQNEYRSEIGIMGGNSFYMGDANNKLFANNQPAFGLIYRHKFDTRMSVTGTWNNTSVVGTGGGVAFDNLINAFDLCAEFNFLDYDDKIYKPNSRKHSLYIFAGIGGMIFPYKSTKINSFMFSYPVGLGYKFMLGERLNLNLSWSNRLLLTDKMEGKSALNNANGLNGSNIFNNDLLSTFSVGLTYNIWKKSCNCLQ